MQLVDSASSKKERTIVLAIFFRKNKIYSIIAIIECDQRIKLSFWYLKPQKNSIDRNTVILT